MEESRGSDGFWGGNKIAEVRISGDRGTCLPAGRSGKGDQGIGRSGRAKTQKMTNQLPTERIENKIYLIRGKKVMLDSELAGLYKVETRVLNQAIRRNIERFPDDFMLSLSREEIMNISQFVISSKIKHSPNVFAFTEQGVAMLSSVLNSKRAIQVVFKAIKALINKPEKKKYKIGFLRDRE